MYSEEQLYSIALRECKLIGDINFNKLIQHFGNAKSVWKFAKSSTHLIDGIGTKTVSEIGKIEHLKFAEQELLFCEKNNIKINLRHKNDFPFLLNECEDAPAILYQKGNFKTNTKAISFVGTRNITSYGKKFINDFFEEAPKNAFVSVSGLALGVDKEAHEQSINNKIPTIAVLAHGFNTLYPAKNKSLSEKIVSENGGLLTEFSSQRRPDRENFLQRNRIIAGLSTATIVVETAFGGGSISTATYANLYNRDVFALPGKITDKYSQGCNHLIFQNKSSAISTIKDLFESLNFNEQKEIIPSLFSPQDFSLTLNPNQKLIYTIIQENPLISLDELTIKTNIASHKILPIILELELLDIIKSFSGRQFSIKS